jgi:hypothetical protein
MRGLSSALSTALGAAVQQPALLVEVAYASTVRWSSFGTIGWNGSTWDKEDVRVDGLSVRALDLAGTLIVGNADGAAGAQALAEGLTDRSIRLWGYDAAATSLGDVVWLADAIAGAVEITPLELRVTLRHPCASLVAPRTYVNPAAGFATLMPAGAVLRINGVDIQIERVS